MTCRVPSKVLEGTPLPAASARMSLAATTRESVVEFPVSTTLPPIDEALPEQPMRSWVLSFPFQLGVLWPKWQELHRIEEIAGPAWQEETAKMVPPCAQVLASA